jgi:hypothetical protein
MDDMDDIVVLIATCSVLMIGLFAVCALLAYALCCAAGRADDYMEDLNGEIHRT